MNQLMDLAKSEITRRMPVISSKMCGDLLRSLIAVVVQSMGSPQVELRHITVLTTTVASEEMVQVRSQHDRFRDALLRLAIGFTPSGINGYST